MSAPTPYLVLLNGRLKEQDRRRDVPLSQLALALLQRVRMLLQRVVLLELVLFLSLVAEVGQPRMVLDRGVNKMLVFIQFPTRSTGLPAYCDTGYCDKTLIVTVPSSKMICTIHCGIIGYCDH